MNPLMRCPSVTLQYSIFVTSTKNKRWHAGHGFSTLRGQNRELHRSLLDVEDRRDTVG
jgi:hypothetical protein